MHTYIYTDVIIIFCNSKLLKFLAFVRTYLRPCHTSIWNRMWKYVSEFSYHECVLIFLRAILLQTYCPTECISSSTWQAFHWRKHRMCGCRTPKQHFIAKACDSISHKIILWRVISVKLSIAKKITGLEIMTLSRKRI